MDYAVAMKNTKLIKFFLVFLTALVTGCFCTALASDYKYKILDPKYNKSIEDYAYDENNDIYTEPEAPKKKIPYKKIALALVLIGGVLVYRTIRVLKKVDKGENMEEFDLTKEFFAVEKAKKLNKTVINAAHYIKDNLNVVKNSTVSAPEKLTEKLESIKTRNILPAPKQTKMPVQNYQNPTDRYVKATMSKMKNPLLITTSKLANDKGLCLVEYKNKYSLIGYIGEDIFILNNFNSLTSPDIRARLSETVEEKDRYIVRLGAYKALVEVSDKKMELLLEL